MKNEYIVTVEVRKLIKVPIEAYDEVEAEALARMIVTGKHRYFIVSIF